MAAKPKYVVALREVPPVGSVIEQGGHHYEVLASRPHRARHGGFSCVVNWRGRCAKCGAPFEQETGPLIRYFHRHCGAHSKWAKRADVSDVPAPTFVAAMPEWTPPAPKVREAEESVGFDDGPLRVAALSWGELSGMYLHGVAVFSDRRTVPVLFDGAEFTANDFSMSDEDAAEVEAVLMRDKLGAAVAHLAALLNPAPEPDDEDEDELDPEDLF